ncbi:S8 family serine peptidase [bacterium]|nr:S8 family serine peptidase [bacterium]
MREIVNYKRLLGSALLAVLLSCSLVYSNQSKYWVFFRDKGHQGAAELEAALAEYVHQLPERTIRRLEKVRSQENLVTYEDLPPYLEYVKAIGNSGAVIHRRSRWFNGVSVSASAALLNDIAQFSFVREITPVVFYGLGERQEEAAPPGLYRTIFTHFLDYGVSLDQLNQINVPPLHELGINGQSVLVCMMDTGYRTSHRAFDSAEVFAAYDFIDSDSIVYEEEGDWPNQMNHGTMTWSALCGIFPGYLYGPAYGASFLLARTEDLSQEMPIEEDNWIAAMEWADSLGAEVINSSLGYLRWDDATGYEYSDLDGNTARITVASDMAAERGIIVCTSAGNSGSAPGSLVTPADADSTIAVGAVGSNDSIMTFSSRGPTADGRIKPTLVARGSGTACATAWSDDALGSAGGTSLSSPLIAGGCALILQVHPGWTPMQVIEALTATANLSTTPNNAYGWGLPDLLGAISYPQNDSCTISLFEGWNMIALPISEPISPAESILPEAIGGLFHYDPELHSYYLTDTLYPGKAYFILYPDDRLITLECAIADSIEIHLQEGWNMIGGIRARVPWESFETLPPHSLLPGSLFDFNPLTLRYELKNAVQPGRGFWVFALNECRLIIHLP